MAHMMLQPRASTDQTPFGVGGVSAARISGVQTFVEKPRLATLGYIWIVDGLSRHIKTMAPMSFLA